MIGASVNSIISDCTFDEALCYQLSLKLNLRYCNGEKVTQAYNYTHAYVYVYLVVD